MGIVVVVVTPVTFRTVVIFLCFFLANPCAAKLETFTRTYHTFNKTMLDQPNSDLISSNLARISQNALQITPDTGSGFPTLDNQSGRIMFARPFKLWDDVNSSTVAFSFNTSFLVNMFPLGDSLPGEGLAFLIAPSTEILYNSNGGYLGLTNALNDNEYNSDRSNGIVAVELDTYKQPFDIDNNHIGLNIHSVRSVVSKSLTPFNITLASKEVTFQNVWIQYNDFEKIIRVYIADQPEVDSPTPPMPETPIIEHKLDLRATVYQESYFGFSASTGTSIQLNCVLRWNITIEHFDEPKRKFKEPLSPLIIAALISVGILGVLVACLGYYLYKKRFADPSQVNILSRLRTLPGMPKEFHFQELKKATNKFDENRKLGQGGFGVVYRAVLPEDNVEVAVKWFSRGSSKGEYDFLAELTIINRLRHKHLVRLLGWCHKNGKLLLVYEYMQNASLDLHLFTTTSDPLSWSLRCKILGGVASALHYLHYEYDHKVVHRDIKASNIMLDSNFNARLGDFGLARALENERTSYAEAEGILGTIGYLAPECLLTGKATQYSDIYAFGAVIIEVVSGKRPGTKMNGFHFMVDYVWSLYREGQILDVVDKRIVADYDAEEAQRLLLLGLACSHPIARERPKTHVIVQILNGSMSVPTVPPFKPDFVYPALMPINNMSLATSIDTIPRCR